MTPKYLVLMSTYNGERFIKEQLDTILAQEGVDVHLLIRDDGSRDSTVAIIKDYMARHDCIRLSASSGENMRPAKSFFALIREADEGYDFYSFADQDDLWHTDKLATAAAALSKCEGPALYSANNHLVDTDGKSLGRNTHATPRPTDVKSLLMSCGHIGCTMVMNKNLMKVAKGCKLAPTVAMHDVYIASLCALVGGQVVYDFEPHMDYRQHGGNTVGTSATKLDAIKNRFDVLINGRVRPISPQAVDLLDEIITRSPEGEAFLKLQANYKTSLKARLRLAFVEKYSCGSRNQTFVNRLAVLIGKA